MHLTNTSEVTTLNTVNNHSQNKRDIDSSYLWWSPEGTIVRSRIAKPIFKYNAQFAECYLELSSIIGNTFVEAIKNYLINTFDELANNPSGSDSKLLKLPYEIIGNKYVFHFDSCTYCRINGVDYSQDIVVTNSAGHTIDSHINGGSSAKIKFSVIPYRYGSNFGAFLKLIAVNVVNDNNQDFIMLNS